MLLRPYEILIFFKLQRLLSRNFDLAIYFFEKKLYNSITIIIGDLCKCIF